MLLRMANWSTKVGNPLVVINIITGAAPAGAVMASHMDVAKIAFTGSAAGGRAVQIATAKSKIKHVSLEVGGKIPAVRWPIHSNQNTVPSLFPQSAILQLLSLAR